VDDGSPFGEIVAPNAKDRPGSESCDQYGRCVFHNILEGAPVAFERIGFVVLVVVRIRR